MTNNKSNVDDTPLNINIRTMAYHTCNNYINNEEKQELKRRLTCIIEQDLEHLQNQQECYNKTYYTGSLKHRLGICYAEQGEFDEAKKHFLDSIQCANELLQSNESSSITATNKVKSLLALSQICLKEGNNEEYLNYIKEIDDLLKKYDINKENNFKTCHTIEKVKEEYRANSPKDSKLNKDGKAKWLEEILERGSKDLNNSTKGSMDRVL